MHHPNDRRNEMPINPDGYAQPFRDAGEITHGVIHQTAVDGTTADQHARFHTAKRKKNSAGLFLGRGWRNVAYTSYIGKDGRRELLLDHEVVGNHCGGINRKSIGVVVEGRYHIDPLPETMLQSTVDECLWHEKQLGRRLIWTWHDIVKPGWNCPGRHFPKDEILRRIEAHYAEPDETGPEDYPPANREEDEDPEPDDNEPEYSGEVTGDGNELWAVLFVALVIVFLLLMTKHY